MEEDKGVEDSFVEKRKEHFPIVGNESSSSVNDTPVEDSTNSTSQVVPAFNSNTAFEGEDCQDDDASSKIIIDPGKNMQENTPDTDSTCDSDKKDYTIEAILPELNHINRMIEEKKIEEQQYQVEGDLKQTAVTKMQAQVVVAEVVPEDAPRNMFDLFETSSDHQDELNDSIDDGDDTIVTDGGDPNETENISVTEEADTDLSLQSIFQISNLPGHPSPPSSPPPPPIQPDVVMKLLSLPLDPLHCIACFLLPSEWSNFGQTSVHAIPFCREIFAKIRMHGFLCATEIVTALKLGQHADARELSALYISSGVPVYPLSLGHSYKTLVWRMGVEAREKESQQRNSDEDNSQVADAFYAERYEARDDGDPVSSLTYLEQKCWFSYHREAANGLSRRIAMDTRANLVPPVLGGGWQGTQRRLSDFRTTHPISDTMHNNHGYHNLSHPKSSVTVHRHLVDQHLMGKTSVNDDDGKITAPISLSTNFFHPSKEMNSVQDQIISSGQINPKILSPTLQDTQSMNRTPPNPLFDEAFLPLADGGLHNADDIFAETEHVVAQNNAFGSQEVDFESPVAVQNDASLPDPLVPRELESQLTPQEEAPSIVSRANLDIYCAGSVAAATDNGRGIVELKCHLDTRFRVYQRRLESFLSQNDSLGFEECLLDFWDEFLPFTSNIHFYDGHTAVPRISGLSEFLTKPCPKAIGIVQCQIERIKNKSKKGVKDRLFPTYEYRLFIRDQQETTVPESSYKQASPPRRDTVLMMAKNRGRKHQDMSGVVQASKKGVNNYYLYMPKQADIDSHYQAINPGSETLMNPNGAAIDTSPRKSDVKTPSLLGRLQSNFIGTEFQIFTPSIKKRPTRKEGRGKTQQVISSDSESDYDSGFSSDNATPASSRRRNRFRRRRSRSTRPRGSEPGGVPMSIEEEGTSSRSPSPEKRKARRSYSLPSFAYRKSNRNSRRAVANAAEATTHQQQQQYETVFCEEEDGAITYTANLLGNRPRIMDVCVPRVSDNGAVGAEWKRYLESVDDSTDVPIGSRMLHRFKQLQQRLDNSAQQNGLAEHEEDAADDYEPPHDFGLLALQNRPPWWNFELSAFVLNFGGRVSVASVKNFQLCDRNDQEHIMLQFGRIQGRHSFTMDFQHPLTAVQAFAIAVSSLQSRISFG